MVLQGLSALITGAGRGIGRAIALRFAQEGCDVAISARTETELSATADLVRETGRKVVMHVGDVADMADVQRMTQGALDTFGKIDILVNNAGYAFFRPVKDLEIAEWQRMLDVNLSGPFYCIKAALPSMLERRSGRIINISSVAGVKPLLEQSAYCAAKHGLNGFTKVLAMELREYGIRVHSICPGGVDTKLSRDAMPHRDPSDFMTPDDIAQAALYLATLGPKATVDEIIIRRYASVPIGG